LRVRIEWSAPADHHGEWAIACRYRYLSEASREDLDKPRDTAADQLALSD
jgi:hypothetical protein